MKSLKKIFVLAVLALFVVNCEKSEPAQINEETQALNFSASAFSSSEIPDIVSSFKKRIDNRKNSINAKEEEQTFWVDEESAIGVRDSLGNMTYTFRMYVENGEENSVYNLVVNRRTDGNHSPDFVMKYEFVDQDILEYSQSQDKSFNGKIDAYSFESFLSSLGNSSKGDSTEPCYDDIGPDPSTNNNTGNTGGSTSGGSGSNSGSGYNPGATTTAGSTSWASAGSMGYTGAQAGGTSRGSVEVGKGCFCATTAPDTKDQKSTTSKGDDCPKGEMLIAINNYEPIEDPSCESFDFYKVGGTGVQVAGVNGIWDVVTKWDRCPGIGVAASYQTYYFHLPARWSSSYAAEKSADALAGAFFDLQKWFQKQPCSKTMTGVLAIKMDEFIKENFKEIGGQATRNAPLGWAGKSRAYKEDWTGTDSCY